MGEFTRYSVMTEELSVLVKEEQSWVGSLAFPNSPRKGSGRNYPRSGVYLQKFIAQSANTRKGYEKNDWSKNCLHCGLKLKVILHSISSLEFGF